MRLLLSFIFSSIVLLIFAQKSKPNIVIILADDLGIGDVSALNPDSKIHTPNIDKLMNQGMTFTDAHSSASVCTPTRYGIMTGQYAWRTSLKKGVLNGYSNALIEDSIKTVPELLHTNGYKTALIGKWHLGWNWATKSATESINEENIDFSKPFTGGPSDHGFDYFYGISASLDFPPYAYCENNHVVGNVNSYFKGGKKDEDKLVAKQKMQRKGLQTKDFDANSTLLNITQHSIDYIKEQKQNQPFFLFVSLTSPHTPVLPSEKFLGTSGAGIYGDFVQEMDWNVGQIVNAIKQMGFDDNTLIIFTADNGASRISFPISYEKKYGHKPSRELHGRKGTMHEGGHHIPFVAVWKNKITSNSKCDTPILLNDFYATFADMLHLQTPKNQAIDSYSILSLLEGKDNNYKRSLSVYTNSGGYFSIRKGEWKMDMHKNIGKRKLYNIIKDREEANNLYLNDDYQEVRKQMLNELSLIVSPAISKQQLAEGLNNSWPQLFWLDKSFVR